MTSQRLLQQQETTTADLPVAPSPRGLLDLMLGGSVAQAISVAARLGIADLIEDGPRPHTELAAAVKVDPGTLYRLLRVLASVGIFAENADGAFELTPLADGLRTKAPTSLRDYAVLLGEEWYRGAWSQLQHSVRTGESAFEHVFGSPIFNYFARNPAAAAVFDAAMTSRGSMEDSAIAAAYDFAHRTVVDVGGGRGSLIATILRQHPGSRGVLFDLSHVVPGAAALVREAGLADRCRFVCGDFFEQIPPDEDVYLMKKIIHDWSDERACRILANCRAAMARSGRLLLLEQVIRPGNAPSLGKVMDLQMLVLTSGGRERTEADYKALLGSAGFELARIIPTKCPLHIIEAMPA